MAELRFLRFWGLIWLKNITNIAKKWTSKTGVKSTFYLLWDFDQKLRFWLYQNQKIYVILSKIFEILTNNFKILLKIFEIFTKTFVILSNTFEILAETFEILSVSYGRISFFTILSGSLTKKYHQYRKKWASKTGVKSTFNLLESELWPIFVFYAFGWLFD